MSHTRPDKTRSKSTVGNNNLGNTDNNKLRDQTKNSLVKNQYHSTFRGTTKFEGKIEVLKAAVYNFICVRQPELYVQTTKEIAV